MIQNQNYTVLEDHLPRITKFSADPLFQCVSRDAVHHLPTTRCPHVQTSGDTSAKNWEIGGWYMGLYRNVATSMTLFRASPHQTRSKTRKNSSINFTRKNIRTSIHTSHRSDGVQATGESQTEQPEDGTATSWYVGLYRNGMVATGITLFSIWY